LPDPSHGLPAESSKLRILGTRREIELHTRRHLHPRHRSLVVAYRGNEVMADCGLDRRHGHTSPPRARVLTRVPSTDPNAPIRTTLRPRGVLATVAPSPARREEPVIDFFVLTSGTFGIFATFLLVYLALRSVRDARDLRVIQGELTVLMRETKDLAEEVHGLQCEIRTDQQAAKDGIDETKRTVEQVTEVVEQAADQVVEAAEQVAEVVVERRRPRLPWRRAARVPVSATAAGRRP